MNLHNNEAGRRVCTCTFNTYTHSLALVKRMFLIRLLDVNCECWLDRLCDLVCSVYASVMACLVHVRFASVGVVCPHCERLARHWGNYTTAPPMLRYVIIFTITITWHRYSQWKMHTFRRRKRWWTKKKYQKTFAIMSFQFQHLSKTMQRHLPSIRHPEWCWIREYIFAKVQILF